MTTSLNNNFYHIEEKHIAKDLPQAYLEAFAAILENSNYGFLVDLYARTSSKCGRCAAACQIYQASNDPRDVPCYRTNLLLEIYKRHFTPGGWLRAKFTGSDPLTEETIIEMAEAFYRCTACRRCVMECPLGFDHGLMTHLGRYILSEIGIVPKGLVVSTREQLQGKTGNTSAIPLPALMDNLDFLQEELKDMTGEDIEFPVDQFGAEYIFYPAVSDYLMEADTLMGNAAMLKAAGISWTIGSQYFDGINYGLFYSDWVLDQVLQKLLSEKERLGAKKILIGECGHAARSAKAFSATFSRNGAPEIVSILELSDHLIQSGKVRLDPNIVTERVTYHDPCNIARNGWIIEQPRNILKSFIPNYVEMTPNGRDNYCCGGGGGLVSLDEIQPFRMEISGKTKAKQILATGAEIVASPCANCKKQLRELMEYNKMPVQVVGVHDLVLRAIQF
jgi:Fe-S oxidoreductase